MNDKQKLIIEYAICCILGIISLFPMCYMYQFFIDLLFSVNEIVYVFGIFNAIFILIMSLVMVIGIPLFYILGFILITLELKDGLIGVDNK